MGPAASETDVKWLEHQIKAVVTTAAGTSGELSAYKKDLHVLSDRVLIIETQRASEKDKIDDLCDSIDAIDNLIEKELGALKEELIKEFDEKLEDVENDLDEKLEEVDKDLKDFKNKFTTKRILTIVSVVLTISVTLIKLAGAFGLSFTAGG